MTRIATGPSRCIALHHAITKDFLVAHNAIISKKHDIFIIINYHKYNLLKRRKKWCTGRKNSISTKNSIPNKDKSKCCYKLKWTSFMCKCILCTKLYNFQANSLCQCVLMKKCRPFEIILCCVTGSSSVMLHWNVMHRDSTVTSFVSIITSM